VTQVMPIYGSSYGPHVGGAVLHLCTIKFEADCSIRSKVISGSQNFEIGSRDPGHAHLGVVLWSTRRRGLSYISVPSR